MQLDKLISLHLTLALILSLCSLSSQQQTLRQIPQENDPSKIAKKKEYASSGIVYTREMLQVGSLEFLRENYAEPFWSRKTYELDGLDVNQTGQLVETKYRFSIHKNVPLKRRNFDAYILEALDQVYKNRLVQNPIHTYDDADDRERTVDVKLVNRIKCDAHINYLLREARRWRSYSQTGDVRFSTMLDPEIGAFFDSYAADEPGSLTGNTVWPGNMNQCEERQIFDLRPFKSAMPTKFNGRYCVASLKSSNWTQLIAEKELKLTKTNYWKYPNQAEEYRKALSLQVGFCLPDSCQTNWLLDGKRREDLRELATLRLHYPFKGYQIDDLWCIPDAQSEFMQFDRGSWSLMITFACWSMLCIWATCNDNESEEPLQSRPLREKLISCFSISRNWSRLTASRKQIEKVDKEQQQQDQNLQVPKPSDLCFLDFFKVLSMLAIIMAHVGNFLFQESKNGLQTSEVGSNWYIYFLISMAFFVDYFFVIAGLITGYVIFSTQLVTKLNTFQWIYTIVHRYIRLGPPFLFVSWFARTLFRFMGSGPYWDYGTTRLTMRKRCMESSYAWPALMITNLHPIHQECLNPTWYISSDMQFYLLTPFILVAMYKYPRFSWLSSLVAVIACIYSRYQIYMTNPLVRHADLARVRHDCYLRNSWDTYELYLHPHHRFPTYLFGLLAGHYVYMVRSGQWKSWFYSVDKVENSTTIRRLARKLLAYASVTMCFVVLRGPNMLDALGKSIDHPDNFKKIISFTYAIQFINSGFWVAVLFVSILFGELQKFRNFCESSLWQILSKFNYFVLLIHVEIIYLYNLNSPNMEIQTLRQILVTYIMTVVSSYTVSCILTTLIELPVAQFERQFIATLFTRGSKSRKTLRKQPNEEHHDDDDDAATKIKEKSH